MALNPAQGETVGWPRFVQTVSSAWRQIPAAERRHTAIFTRQLRRGRRDRPPRIGAPGSRAPTAATTDSANGECHRPADTRALLVGFDSAADAAPYFDQCRTLATVNDGVGLNNHEQGLPVMLCRRTGPWPALWPHLTHYD